jgi:hypothetical protein
LGGLPTEALLLPLLSDLFVRRSFFNNAKKPDSFVMYSSRVGLIFLIQVSLNRGEGTGIKFQLQTHEGKLISKLKLSLSGLPSIRTKSATHEDRTLRLKMRMQLVHDACITLIRYRLGVYTRPLGRANKAGIWLKSQSSQHRGVRLLPKVGPGVLLC